MADFLGLDKQQEKPQQQGTPDFLGNIAPTAFSSQPSLPAAGPGAGAGGGPSTAPATMGGAGVAAPVAPQPLEGFGQLANTALGVEPGGGGEAGGNPGAPGGLGQGFSGGLLGSLTPANSPISISPFGGLGVNTGNQMFDTAMNTAGKAIAGLGGIPTSLPGIISLLSHSGVAGAVSAALGAIGLPFSVINAVHMLASLSPNTIAGQQNALESAPFQGGPFALSPEEMAAVQAHIQAQGPAVDTPMTQGTMGWSPANTATAPRPNDPVDAPPGVPTGVPTGPTATPQAEDSGGGPGTGGAPGGSTSADAAAAGTAAGGEL